MQFRMTMLAATLAFAGAAVFPASAQEAGETVPPTYDAVGLEWRRSPRIADMTRHYPRRAWVMGIRRGRASVDCTARANGKLDCVVANEDPTDVFFGQAALNVMRPATVRAVDGGSPEGRRFRFTLKFGHWPPSTLPAYMQLDRFGLKWTRMPHIVGHWNGAGLDKGETYSVALDCVADAIGAPVCEVTDESRASKGFVVAVRKALEDARVKSLDGASPEGKRFTYRITMGLD